ncbi:MAG: homoaconitate hydratase family protein [Candidatus Heimdallarchaeota archaeon]|nr:homoaconitate hydratase family protein [Candidatus Heimdallarchaeota archaeon]MCK4255075.1 homoaconitate hydratase family protein [Candidatus Heimdallarchaeota archaeon]
MVGFTLIEKIIRKHIDAADEDIYPSNIVWINLDMVTARDYAGPQVIDLFQKHYPGSKTFDHNKIIFTPDCYPYGNDPKHAKDQEKIRVFAKEHDIQVTDLGSGIGSHLLFRRGFSKPGDIVIGADSHYNILGALGILGQGAGDVMLAFAFKTGKSWIKIPETVKVILEGKYTWPTTSKDLALYVLKQLHEYGITGKAIEFYGDVISELTIEDRVTLCSLITEASGMIGFVPTDEVTTEYYKQLNIDIEVLTGDENANYASEFTINIDNLGLYVACPPHPHNVKPIEEVLGTPINSIILGSCTNGSASDIHEAARVLKGFQIKPEVRFGIVPATREDFVEINLNKDMTIILEAGGNFFGAGCSTCAKGQYGLTGGETAVTLTTGNRNTQGKIGPADVYLASPVVAAATAIEGKIAKPIMRDD